MYLRLLELQKSDPRAYKVKVKKFEIEKRENIARMFY